MSDAWSREIPLHCRVERTLLHRADVYIILTFFWSNKIAERHLLSQLSCIFLLTHSIQKREQTSLSKQNWTLCFFGYLAEMSSILPRLGTVVSALFLVCHALSGSFVMANTARETNNDGNMMKMGTVTYPSSRRRPRRQRGRRRASVFQILCFSWSKTHAHHWIKPKLSSFTLDVRMKIDRLGLSFVAGPHCHHHRHHCRFLLESSGRSRLLFSNDGINVRRHYQGERLSKLFYPLVDNTNPIMSSSALFSYEEEHEETMAFSNRGKKSAKRHRFIYE